jgi:hypothetical protein
MCVRGSASPTSETSAAAAAAAAARAGDLDAAKPLVAQNLARAPGQNLTRVAMQPLQLHFHARSEHLVGGALGRGSALRACNQPVGAAGGSTPHAATFCMDGQRPPPCKTHAPRAGRAYPLEMHILHRVSNLSAPGCPPFGCLATVGVLFELAAEGEATASTGELEKIFGRIPSVEHEDVSGARGAL